MYNIAKKEYETYIKIDFSDITASMKDIFVDIANRDMFLLNALKLILNELFILRPFQVL